jgi:hypothetical protein
MSIAGNLLSIVYDPLHRRANEGKPQMSFVSMLNKVAIDIDNALLMDDYDEDLGNMTLTYEGFGLREPFSLRKCVFRGQKTHLCRLWFVVCARDVLRLKKD